VLELYGSQELAESRPVAQEARLNFGILNAERGRFDDANKAIKLAFDQRTQYLGPQHPSTLETQIEFALVLQKQEKFPSVEKNFRRVIESCDTMSKYDSASISNRARYLLGELYLDWENHNKGRKAALESNAREVFEYMLEHSPEENEFRRKARKVYTDLRFFSATSGWKVPRFELISLVETIVVAGQTIAIAIRAKEAHI